MVYLPQRHLQGLVLEQCKAGTTVLKQLHLVGCLFGVCSCQRGACTWLRVDVTLVCVCAAPRMLLLLLLLSGRVSSTGSKSAHSRLEPRAGSWLGVDCVGLRCMQHPWNMSSLQQF